MKSHSRNVLLRFSISYLAVLLLPLAMGICTYLITNKLLREQNIRINQILLSGSVDRIDSSLLEAANFNNYTLNTLSGYNQPLTHISSPAHIKAYDIYQLMNMLPHLTDTNSLIERYFVYYFSGEFILEPKRAYIRPRLYYDSCFCFGNMTYEQWCKTVLNSVDPITFYPSTTNCYLTQTSSSLLMTLPHNANSGQILGRTVFFIDESRLHEILATLLENGALQLLIYDSSGRLLSIAGKEEFRYEDPPISLDLLSAGNHKLEINDEPMFISMYKSPVFKWTYLLLTPNSVITNQATAMLKPFFIGIGLLLLVGLGLALISFHYNRQPLRRIVNLLPLEGKNYIKKGLWCIEQAVMRLTMTNKELESRATLRHMQLRNICINQLVNGTILDIKEFEKLMQYADLRIKGDCFRGVYMCILGQDAYQNHSQIFEVLQDTEVPLLLSFDTNGYLLVVPGDDELGIDRLYDLCRVFKSRYGLLVTFYVGILCKSIEQLSISFESARNLINTDITGKHYVIIAEEYKNKTYDYTVNDEFHLLTSIEAGRMDSIHKILCDLYSRNFQNRKLDALRQQLFYSRCINTLLSLNYLIDLPDEFMCLPIRLEPSQFFSLLEKQFMNLCDISKKKRHESISNLATKVIEYINANYERQDMSLAHLSTQFKISENYLSTIIKRRIVSSCSG